MDVFITVLMYLFALLGICAVGFMLIKKMDIKITLFTVGMVLIIFAMILGKQKVANVNDVLSPFTAVVDQFKKTLPRAGLIMLVLGGYTAYMTKIGANNVTVYALTKPLKKIKSPWIMVPFVFLMGNLLSLVIPSASTLAIIFMAILYPVLRKAGMSTLTAAAVIATTATVMPTPLGGDNVAVVGELVKAPGFSDLTVVDYVYKYHAPISVPTLFVMAIVHFFWQMYMDKLDFRRELFLESGVKVRKSRFTKKSKKDQEEELKEGEEIEEFKGLGFGFKFTYKNNLMYVTQSEPTDNEENQLNQGDIILGFENSNGKNKVDLREKSLKIEDVITLLHKGVNEKTFKKFTVLRGADITCEELMEPVIQGGEQVIVELYKKEVTEESSEIEDVNLKEKTEKAKKEYAIEGGLLYKIVYAILPVLPIIILIISYIINIAAGLKDDKAITLNVAIVTIVSFVISIIIELIRRRNAKEVLKDTEEFFKGMGKAMIPVALLVAAGVFVQGLKSIGVIAHLEETMKNLNLPGFVLPLILVALTAVIVLLSGSGVALFYAMVPLMVPLAAAAKISPIAVTVPMGLAGNLLRAVSPVSAVVVIVAADIKQNPVKIVKRTAIPMIAGVLFMFVVSMIVYAR